MAARKPIVWAALGLSASMLLAITGGVNAQFGPPPAAGAGSQQPFGPPPGAGSGPFGPPPDAGGGGGSLCPSPRSATPSSSSATTTTADCPTDDGNIYATSSGDYMYIQCCTERQTGRLLGAEKAADFGACMDLCMKEDSGQCRSVTFTADSTGRSDGRNCALWAHGGFSPDEASIEISHHAYYVEAPYVDQPDDEIELCSTECPGAHNQVFKSNYGESFLMMCGRRHGVPGITQYVDSYEQCIDACGLIGQCKSVDYHARTGRCTFGEHGGEAMIEASGYASAWSMGCSGACKEYPKPPAPAADESCPKYHESLWMIENKPYQSRCSRGRWPSGNNEFTLDAGPVTMEECMQKCKDSPSCKTGYLLFSGGKCIGADKRFKSVDLDTYGQITDHAIFEELPTSPTGF